MRITGRSPRHLWRGGGADGDGNGDGDLELKGAVRVTKTEEKIRGRDNRWERKGTKSPFVFLAHDKAAYIATGYASLCVIASSKGHEVERVWPKSKKDVHVEPFWGGILSFN